MKKVLMGLIGASLLSAPVLAHQAGDIIVRAGFAVVTPNESSPDVLGLGEFSVDGNTQLGLNFGYMITDNWAVELLAATPFSHDITLANTVIAETKHLPPTLVAQYYFGEAGSQFRPYIGVGVNFTNFFDNEFNAAGKNLGLADLSMSNSWGVAAQIGADYKINKNWLFNASVWYAQISTDVSFNATPTPIKTDIDP
ncbi:MAG: outer membrane protein OmpW, partial [Shewanella sp.]